MATKVLFLISTLTFSTTAISVTEYKKTAVGFSTKLSDLRPSILLDTIDEIEPLEIPLKKLKIRSKNYHDDERIEPVQIKVPTNPKEFELFVDRISNLGRKKQVADIFRKAFANEKSKKNHILLDLDRSTVNILNLQEISQIMARNHVNVRVLSQSLRQRLPTKNSMMKQLEPFFSERKRRKIFSKIEKGKDLILHRDLLPKFAKKMVKKYSIYRGPNCFHAALAFHDQRLPMSKKVNIKQEKGYHRAMINYDELWRAINRHFYEVDPGKSELKYGDMLVFFNLPQGNFDGVNFRWIRHTSTYLFDKYTFSKGSKSPNTPYAINTIEQEWHSWANYTKRLGVKVYRRSTEKTMKSTPKDLTDWVF